MKKFNSVFFVIILSLSINTVALPQSKAKANETIKVVTNLMKKCINHNWMLYDIRLNEKPFMNYNVIFNENASGKIDPSILDKRDQYFKGEFGLDPRSELSKKLIDPLDNEFIRMSSEKPEPQDSMDAITKKEREIGVVYVYVYINKKKIEGKKFTGEKIPGAALVTMIILSEIAVAGTAILLVLATGKILHRIRQDIIISLKANQAPKISITW